MYNIFIVLINNTTQRFLTIKIIRIIHKNNTPINNYYYKLI